MIRRILASGIPSSAIEENYDWQSLGALRSPQAQRKAILAAGVDICNIVLENIGVVYVRYCAQKLHARSSIRRRVECARQMVWSWSFPTQIPDRRLSIRDTQELPDGAVVAFNYAVDYGPCREVDCRSKVVRVGTACGERGAYCQEQRERTHPGNVTAQHSGEN